MSRWSNDSRGGSVNVGIGTREIAVSPRASRSLRWGRFHKTALTSSPRSVLMSDAQRYTESGVFDALRAALAPISDDGAPPAKQAPSRNRRAHIVLDDFWGNHAILRGDFRTLRTREIDEIARAHFVDTYGVDAEAIVVRACVQRGGRALFASALPRTLVDGIRETGTAAGVDIEALKLCLPEMLNRTLNCVPQANAMLVFAADALMQAVLIEAGHWVGYDVQRLFDGDADDSERIAALAVQAFERCAEGSKTKRQDCALGLYGFDVDHASLQAGFASVTMLASCAADTGNETGNEAGDRTRPSFACRLLEYAQ
ncbi:hypothetical protein [Paraburkholderia diazotrophica]|uniref:Uncharacterized protein n=1 Tax=Paraburkholderia diazotrophica TaxID=667676 RepID=A0A1H7ED28_9BURK|nr:hypothetical protein [Paraburkholderia diazotrophica]SEK09982.1 hypothetical protein SAMN05192539_104634 [Paraburkholderia diazotrophica]